MTPQVPDVGDRRRHSSGGPWEGHFGYSRAVRVGDHIVVSGCTAVGDDAALASSDARQQAEAALSVALAAVTALGGHRDDVVRTRMYLTRREDADAVAAMATRIGERLATDGEFRARVDAVSFTIEATPVSD